MIEMMFLNIDIAVAIAILALSCKISCFPIINSSHKLNPSTAQLRSLSTNKIDTKLNVFTQQQQLEFWITAFSSAHIGMSAVRDGLIKGCGDIASRINIIDRGLKLPAYWPGKKITIPIVSYHEIQSLFFLWQSSFHF